MRLTHDGKHFIFEDAGMQQAVEILKTGKWKAVNPDDYVTSNRKAAARFWQYADDKAEKILNRAFVKTYPAPTRPLPPFLDPHQVEGIMWALTRSRSYLAHAPGAGKTLEALIASLYTPGDDQTLFIVPPSLTANWVREIEHWLSRLYPKAFPSISVIPESKHKVFTGWKSDFLICPDSMLAKEWVLSRLLTIKKKFIGVDEASRFKDPKAERTKVLFGGTLKDKRVVPGLIYSAARVVLLDGSPMPNRPMELWAPTYAMSPESIEFMTEEEFGFKYCGPKYNARGYWEFKHESNGDELRLRLQKNFMHVVPEEKLNHPERRRTLLYMTKDARTPEMRKWEKRSLERLNLDVIDEEASQGELATYRREIGLRKVDWISDYVAWRLRTKNESILLFAWHREVCQELCVKLASKFKVGLVMGGTPSSDREHYFENFQAGEMKLIIGNISAMGRGHNLQRADRVIFGEYSWTDELNKQCEKRASRKGSTKLITRCDYIVSPDSLDEKILKSVMRKAQSVKRIIG